MVTLFPPPTQNGDIIQRTGHSTKNISHAGDFNEAYYASKHIFFASAAYLPLVQIFALPLCLIRCLKKELQ